MYENKKILILGAAKSGLAVAKLLAGKNNDITISDINPLSEHDTEILSKLGIKIIITNKQVDLLKADIDLVIKNPAIMYTSDITKRCEELKLRVENELEVAYHFLKKDLTIIGVTGSNGKTTTTTLIYDLLKLMGYKVTIGGNIGTPLADLVDDANASEILLLEVSDHQLCDIHDFKTTISVLTNICPTHLDYHGTYEHYMFTKKKIFNKHTSSDIAIINKGNKDALIVSDDILSKKKYFSSNGVSDIYFDGRYIWINEKRLDTEDILLKGIHNYENIMAALLVLQEFKIDFDIVNNYLHNFKGVTHRLEYVKSIDGVEYYNDSKSTNPTSTITALKTFNKPVHLILGGLDRHQNFHELDAYMTNVCHIYAIGETTNLVSDYATSLNIPCFKAYKLVDAISKIKENVKSGEVVLLSPGSSSQDQYPHFEDRGLEFKNELEKY